MIVEATGLRKSYGGTEVLSGVDLTVAEGEVVALLGPNGAGKTTTVRILTTLSRPTGGHATIAGYDVVRDAAKVREVISLTGQFAAVDAEQTGRENLVMVGRLMHLGRGPARQRAGDLLDRFGLTDAMDRRVKTYSGGMRRRLDLAMSLIGRPRVIFLDEPTTGLDPASRLTMWDAIGELVRDGTTIVLTTQYLEEADRLADRIVLLDHGRITAAGTADALKSQIGGERIELFFADPADAVKTVDVLGGVADGVLVNLPSDGTATHLHAVLDELRAQGLQPVRVSSHRPTLDDVFLTLTA
ncbi:daunorubicin resistance ABC transporter ATPase subunit [Kribbella flavida DSM 17836]|uniref:Daunorubicin resistance ABC transporter ATPase subunit n=1 Tax=Kribbella flavida (strain DSM 17836 / JCM 10339 / NBRC 14399) TaxID=479435 RepID=D2PL50_KRIFD|nr:daunorubicin resistance protein DrrA family ABC transporter ATP-binding protein [Kribbella flavida]ADB34305.1 daunorubicin resistance ABC transporter ATPase subunit [Kribbella flavida DSM 17836]